MPYGICPEGTYSMDDVTRDFCEGSGATFRNLSALRAGLSGEEIPLLLPLQVRIAQLMSARSVAIWGGESPPFLTEMCLSAS